MRIVYVTMCAVVAQFVRIPALAPPPVRSATVRNIDQFRRVCAFVSRTTIIKMPLSFASAFVGVIHMPRHFRSDPCAWNSKYTFM